MAYSTILAKIKTLLLAVTGVGTKVYDFEQCDVGDWNNYLTLFKEGSLIKGWEITRIGAPEVEDSPSANLRTHQIVIRGFYSLNNASASEKTFQDLIEAICTAFRAKAPDLEGTAFMLAAPSVSVIENRMFGEVLCHFCEIRLDVTEHIQWR